MIFGGYSLLRYPNETILDSMVLRVTRVIHNARLRNIANLLSYCEKLNYKNDYLLDTIEQQLIKRLEPYLKLLYDEITEKKVEREVIQEENSEEISEENVKEDQENEDSLESNSISKYEDEISVDDICFILTSFVKLKIVKPKLFEVLEGIFMKKIYEATPTSIAVMAFCHSSLSNDLLMKYNENKTLYLKRSFKRIKLILTFTLGNKIICSMKLFCLM